MALTTRSCAELAAHPYGLLEALLRRDTCTALQLLDAGGGGAASQLALTGPGLHFTALHAAALSGCAEAIPALVAAGVPMDAALEKPEGSLRSAGAAPLRALLAALSADAGARNNAAPRLHNGATALAVAVQAGQHRCVQQLLEAGADPAAGKGLATALYSLRLIRAPAVECVLQPFLQHGLDPLAPLEPPDGASLLVSCYPGRTADLLLDHLEQQRTAGSLQLGSWQGAQQLLQGAVSKGAADGRHAALLEHSIAACEQLLGVAGGAGSQMAAPAIAVAQVQRVLQEAVAFGRAAAVQSLLASRLPCDVRAQPSGMSLLQFATINAKGDALSAVLRLLLQAGAVVTAHDLYTAVEWRLPAALTALLSCGAPAVDVCEPQGPGDKWSCPIHRVLYGAMLSYCFDPQSATAKPHAQALEALTAAGFRPAVYRHARLPDFLKPSSDAGVFAELDPLALLDTAHPQNAQLTSAVTHWAYKPAQRPPPAVLERLVHLARGGGWSPAAHRLWPDSFKAAARTLLLCASVSSRPLGGLPPGVLLQVVRLAAEPMSAWL